MFLSIFNFFNLNLEIDVEGYYIFELLEDIFFVNWQVQVMSGDGLIGSF